MLKGVIEERYIRRNTTEPFYLTVAKGYVKGHTFIHKFGANFNVNTNTDPETVWSGGGLYPWSSFNTAQSIYLLSTSGSDVGDIEIQGLDENYVEQTETITLNGTTPVTTVNTFIRLFRLKSKNTNVGLITARVSSGTGTIVAQIDAGKGQTLMAVYTVPANKTAYLMSTGFSVQKNKDAQVQLFQRTFSDNAFRITNMAETFENIYRYTPVIPIVFSEKTDIELRVDNVEFNNTRVTGDFDLLIVDNDAFK